jgi:hypothetical protein
MRRRDMDEADDDSQPVMVPRSEKVPAPICPERKLRLRRHLVAALRGSRLVKDDAPSASPMPSAPESFTARVAHAACSLCKGWCCKGGGDHAYLDERTLQRVRRARPDLDARAVLRLYTERVPAVGYDGSCLFHGEQGCTLSRSLRSDVCNSYFCSGLDAFIKGSDSPSPVVVIAGEGDKMRTSAILMP